MITCRKNNHAASSTNLLYQKEKMGVYPYIVSIFQRGNIRLKQVASTAELSSAGW